MTTTTPPVTLDTVRDAADRLKGVAHRTPVLRSRTLDALVGAEVFLKCENFQRVGAFKFRGAYNAASRLTPEQLTRGIAAYSSGNHAQAVALAARELGTTAVIVMPEDAPRSKVDATIGYGAEIVTYDRYTEDRVAVGAALAARELGSRAVIVMPEDAPASKVAATAGYGAEIVRYDRYTGDRNALCRQLAEERGLTLIPPYDHPHVIAGQGTVALELIEETGPLDALLAPVGGGGLMAGSALAATALAPGIRMIGVEPAAGDDTRRSLAAGHPVTIPVPRTIADGQAVESPGELTFSVNRRLLDSVVLVSDDEIRAAMKLAFERLKIVTEPSGASALAALLAGRIDPLPPRVGVIISGGNVGVERFLELLG